VPCGSAAAASSHLVVLSEGGGVRRFDACRSCDSVAADATTAVAAGGSLGLVADASGAGAWWAARASASLTEREPTGTGFHRELRTALAVPAAASKRGCVVMLAETLPHSVFVDAYQLQELSRLAGARAMLMRDVDLEKPALECGQNVVLQWAAVDGQSGVARFALPLHFRYQEPSHEPFVSVAIQPPRAAMRCDGEESWAPLEIKQGRAVAVAVPAGNLGDGTAVVVGTSVFTLGGAALVLRASLMK